MLMSFDKATIDSTGIFLIGELERLDQTLNEPLVDVTWGRDIQLRTDVTIADEAASFTNTNFASPGMRPNGVSWIARDANNIPQVSIDIGKTMQPLHPWGEQLSFTILELASAQQAGRPIEDQKFRALRLKHQMDIDSLVYIGDTDLSFKGLLNHASVTPASVANGAAGTPAWTTKTPSEILKDVNELLSSVWTASGWKVMPDKLLLPPLTFGYLVSQLVSNAGNMSIYTYLRENSLCNSRNNRPLDIQPVKWLTGRGAGNTDRMIAYTNDRTYVRYPMTPLQRTPVEFRGLQQSTVYYCRMGQIEFVYPTTVGYRDGI